MRLFLLSLAIAWTGCFFPTPLVTPEPLPEGQTRVDAGIDLLFPTVGANVRRGLGGGREASARASWVPGSALITLGGGLQQRLTRPGAPTAVSVRLDGSFSRTGGFDSDTYTAVYPTLIAGTDQVYGGARAVLPIDDSASRGDIVEDALLGGFVGLRLPAASYAGLELFVAVPPGLDGVVVLPTVTFGLAPNRSAEGVPAPANGRADTQLGDS